MHNFGHGIDLRKSPPGIERGCFQGFHQNENHSLLIRNFITLTWIAPLKTLFLSSLVFLTLQKHKPFFLKFSIVHLIRKIFAE